MQLILRLGRRVAAFVSRAWLTFRFWKELGYGWHLAWIKAERTQ